MTTSKKTAPRFVTLAAGALMALAGTQAQAGFTLTETGLSINGGLPTTSATIAFGGTMIGLTPLSPQTFTAGSGLNLINVAAQSSTTVGSGDTGTFNFAETFTLVGTGTATGLTESVTLTGTFNLTQGLQGAIITNMGSPSNTAGSIAVTINSGSGFTLNGFGYSQPSPNSSVANPSTADGNLSLTIIPAVAVPEPASLAMVGMGALGIAGVMIRRRRTA